MSTYWPFQLSVSDGHPVQIPTLILALGSIAPRLRSDIIFSVSFFTTRIVLHIALCISLILQRWDVTNGSFGPAIVMACILPLHAHWFTGCIKGLLKQAKAAEKSVPVKLPVNIISLPGTSRVRIRLLIGLSSLSSERPITPSVSVPVALYTSRASLARRRTALRMAVRARWDQLKLWKTSGRFNDMQRRVRAALPARDRVYQYVGLETMSAAPAEQGLEYVRDEASFLS